MADLTTSQLHFNELPEGTITFLFTDIESSTQLLSPLRDQYATLLSDQRRILRESFARWNGQEVDTQGDAFFVAFPRATQAVSASVGIQCALAANTWPEEVEVRVRMFFPPPVCERGAHAPCLAGDRVGGASPGCDRAYRYPY